jgi:hypothetical protein
MLNRCLKSDGFLFPDRNTKDEWSDARDDALEN